MRLQSQDYITANQIQQELARLIPNDPLIRQFAAILPDEAEYQEATREVEEEDDGEASEYYDEEDPDDEPEEAEAIVEDPNVVELTTDLVAGAAAAAEEEKESSSENSDYDEEGNYIWGAEN